MISFDTNVLLYAADHRDPIKREVAVKLLASAEDAVLLWQSACEFIAASRKLAAHGLSVREAWDQLHYYLSAFPLVVPTEKVLAVARTLHLEHQWSFWDAMLVSAALEAGVTRVYSEDEPGRAAPLGIEIINPFC